MKKILYDMVTGEPYEAARVNNDFDDTVCIEARVDGQTLRVVIRRGAWDKAADV